MRLSQEAINEFKQIYLEEYGKELSDQEALEKATKFLLLMKAIYQPIPRENRHEINKKT